MAASEKLFTVYLMTHRPRGVFYFGVTSDLLSRVLQHRAGAYEGHSSKWRCRRLVWYETFPDADSAISFEKRRKRWRREWKIAMVEKTNPTGAISARTSAPAKPAFRSRIGPTGRPG